MDLEHEERLSKVEERAKSNSHRITEIEKEQDNIKTLAYSVSALAEREKHVEDDVKEIKNDVKTLTGKPAQRWENLVSQVITLVIAAVVGFLLAKIGL